MMHYQEKVTYYSNYYIPYC